MTILNNIEQFKNFQLMAKLQVAIVLFKNRDAIALATKVAPYIDNYRMGTHFIKKWGIIWIERWRCFSR